MRWLRILRLRFRSLSQRAQLERELEDELRFHFDRQVEQNIASGMNKAEAQQAAVRRSPIYVETAISAASLFLGLRSTVSPLRDHQLRLRRIDSCQFHLAIWYLRRCVS